MTRTDFKRFVPLMSVVKASIVDCYGDLNRLQEYHLHFAGRAVRTLQREVLKSFPRYALLPVNQNTFTATLPTDFGQATFVGVVDAKGVKMPLISNHNLALRTMVESIEPKEKCAACNQPLSVCEDLRLSETINLIEINGNTYEEKVIKKLYPNGDYFLETTTPFINIMPATIDEVLAFGYITIDGIGEVGDTIKITVDDQVYGTITLADYVRKDTDTDTTILAASIAEAINDNVWGYTSQSDAEMVNIWARLGIGSAINGGDRLKVEFTSATLALDIVPTARTATITWNAVTNPDATDVYYVELLENGEGIFADYRTSPFERTALTPQTVYNVRVTPTNTDGGLLEPSSGWVEFSTGIEVPLTLEITPTDTTVNVTWDAEVGIDYKVELSEKFGDLVEEVFQSSPYDATGLLADTTYTIRVTPVNEVQAETYPSSGPIDFVTTP